MNKPKIAMIALYRGGIGHYIAEISPYLNRYFDLEYISYKYGLPGDEVTLDDPAIAKNLYRKPHFIIAYNHYKETVESIGQTIKLLKAKKIDILNVHVSTMTRETVYFIVPLILAAKKIGLKILYTFHDVGSFEDYRGGEEILSFFYSLYDGATVGNKNELKKLHNLQLKNDNVEIAPHGLYTIFDFNKYSKESARRHLGIGQDKKVILNFGILRSYKGFDDTIAAMPQILKKTPKAFLFISAGVRVEDTSGKLISLIKKYKIGKYSKTSFEFVNAKEIEPIFKSCDIVVLPYRQVSQSGILNLALNFHKPVILSDLFSEAKLVNKKMGLIVSPGKIDQISKAATELLLNTDFYNQCSKNIKEYVKNDKTWFTNVEAVRKVVKNMK